MTTEKTQIHPELGAQREYIKQLKLEGFGFELVAAEAFIRGIRDIGYKSTATALDELIDNSIQAGATNVNVVFGYSSKNDNKPNKIAIIDDGHGMDPDMLRVAMIWGGTHRENDRKGFGRYGYGLPSACISQGRRFSVISKVSGGNVYCTSLDLEDIGSDIYKSNNGRITIPEAKVTDVPTWIMADKDCKTLCEGRSFTIVVIEKLDRLSWVTSASLERNLLEQFGVTYRNYLGDTAITVNAKKVEPVDPLFLTEGFRFYALDEDRATALEPLNIEVKASNDGKKIGVIKVRFASFPLRFSSKDKSKEAVGENRNGRFSVIADNNGIIILRAGRQIDVVTRNPWTRFINYDRYWGLEIDFPPVLDEEFSVTTSKQQIVISDRMWAILKEAGVYRAIESLRKRHKDNLAKAKAQAEEDATKQRASEQAMADAIKFKTEVPTGDIAQQEADAEKNLDQEAKRRAKDTKKPFEELKQDIITEIEGNPYKIRTESLPGAPFYRPEQLGGQRVIWLNTAHPFYTEIYMASETTSFLRSGLEVLLFVFGDSELDSSGERRLFYQTSRADWSNRIAVILQLLQDYSISSEEAVEEPAG